MNPSIASEVSNGQIEACVSLLTDATRKSAGTSLRKLINIGALNRQNIERVRARGNEIVAGVIKIVEREFINIAMEGIHVTTHLIPGAENLDIVPTDGSETIFGAVNTFSGYIDKDFGEPDCNVRSEPTKRTAVSVRNVIKGKFTIFQLCHSLDHDLHNVILTQPQVIAFVKRHKEWLGTERCRTFFVLKVGGEFFVACVFNINGRTKVFRYSLLSICDDWVSDSCSVNIVIPKPPES